MQRVVAWHSEERRLQTDRRAHPTTFREAVSRRGRRRGFRRAGEGVNAYVDRLQPLTAALSVFVVLASSFDAFLTLLHLGEGGSEANPVMQLALDHGVGAFLSSKVLLTATGAWVLAVHQNFPLGKKGLRCLVILYLVLTAYHLALLGVRGP
jgi:hypothetical protein